MSVTPPEELTYGKVVGRFLLSVADTTDDPDREPDAKAAEGLTVTLTPKTLIQRVEGASPVTVLRSSITCTVGADGWLHDPAGAAGVWLVTGVYTVSYKATGLAGFSLPSQHTIEVTAEHTDEAPLDLTTALPYTPPAGVTVQTVPLPTGASAGKVLGWTASGAAWVTPEEAGAHTHEPEEVTGLAAVASSGSYNDLTDTPSIPATASDVGAADAEHTHPAEDITGLATVATSGDYDDLENKPSIPSTPGDIGAAAASHQHAAGDITSGTIAPARLGSGTADDTKFLRGDGTWQVPPAGDGGVAPLIRTPAVGRWMTSPNFIATGFSTAGEVRNDGRMPLYVPEAMTIDQVAFSVGTAEEAANWTVTLLDDTGATLSTLGSADLSTTGQKVITLAEPLALDPGWYFIKGSGHTWNAAKFCTARITGWGSASNRPDPVFVSAAGWPPVDEFNVGWQQNVVVFWVRRSA